MSYLTEMLAGSWQLLLNSSIYVLFGLLVGGMLKVFLNPSMVSRHLGRGKIAPVFKAAALGVPLPLCSCGVLPAAAAMKKQGANNGATTAFLISTPESGVDSMAMTYALMDPLMTIARPIAALITAISAGIVENLAGGGQGRASEAPDLTCPVDGCCDGVGCDPREHARHHSLLDKLRVGVVFAAKDLWGDLAGWFLLGILLAGVITSLIPEDFMARWLGGGLPGMLIMLVVGVPLYICASGSTPIAAALILKGVSPGAALVFLLAGPATNVTSLTVLTGLLGKRATAIYLLALSCGAVASGLLLDQAYGALGISAQAAAGQAAELVPLWAKLAGTMLLLALSVKPLLGSLKARLTGQGGHHHSHGEGIGHVH